MSGPRSEQIAEALRSYVGPRDAVAILAGVRDRHHARQKIDDNIRRNIALDLAKKEKISRRLELENRIFSYLRENPPQCCGVRGITTCRDIISLCAERFGFTYADLISHRRWVSLVRARQVAMWLICKSGRRSYPEIGRIMDRDHTTIMHGVKRIEAMMSEDEAFRDRVEAILNEVTLLPNSSE